MAASDIKYRYSGGAGNNDPNAALGGAMSTAGELESPGALHDLFDAVSSAEASAGDTEYRGIYILNTHGTVTLVDARIYFTTAANDLDIAPADEAINSTIETIANEGTAPVGPVFSHPTTYAGGIVLNGSTGLAAADDKGIWVRRVIPSSAGAEADHTETLRVEGDMAA